MNPFSIDRLRSQFRIFSKGWQSSVNTGFYCLWKPYWMSRIDVCNLLRLVIPYRIFRKSVLLCMFHLSQNLIRFKKCIMVLSLAFWTFKNWSKAGYCEKSLLLEIKTRCEFHSSFKLGVLLLDYEISMV